MKAGMKFLIGEETNGPAAELAAFQREQSIFTMLNLVVVALLLLSHTLLAKYWGEPPKSFAGLLLGTFLIYAAALMWIPGVETAPGEAAERRMSWASAGLNAGLSLTLALLAREQNVQYGALMAIPVMEAAFRFSLGGLTGVVGTASFLNFFWVWWYARTHGPVDPGEYLEAGTMSVLYVLTGVVVWLMARLLKEETREVMLGRVELKLAQERLLKEEKLAAVGRLASGIAHEVRNPVAMIASSLEMALHEDLEEAERDQMFGIAAKEAERLEKLTGDFLRYARPANVERHPEPVAVLLEYVASACRARAAGRGVEVAVEAEDGLKFALDGGQTMQAVLNLALNGIEASEAGGRVVLGAAGDGGELTITVENGNGPIAEPVKARMFEPFFTTKAGGTGLGLAIARNVAVAHGGDLTLERNEADEVRFAMRFQGAGKGSGEWAEY